MNETKLSPYSYIFEQVKIFVLNRLAQASSTTQQLASSFALLVDDLSVSEQSIDHVLDALYKENSVDFEIKNGVRYYSLLDFQGDIIFDLDLEKVEQLIVEENVPYYENVEPSNDDDLYFEKIDEKICIQINKPLMTNVETSIENDENACEANEETRAEESYSNLFDENIVPAEDKKEKIDEDQTIKSDIVNNRTIDYTHSKEVNQSSYLAMGNTDESDDLIMKVFAKHLAEVKPKEEKEEPIISEPLKEDNSRDEEKESTGDNIVFTSEIIIDSPKISPEEEALRIENALKKLNEYANHAPKKQETEEVVDEVLPEPEEKESKTETPPSPTPDFSNKHTETEPKSNVLSVRKYIEEQEKINNYDWEKKLSRVFVDANNDLEEEVESVENNVIVSTYSELKDIMEKKNYKFKAYSNYDSVSFYSQNYVFSNRITKDASIYTYLFMLLEIVLAYFLVDKYVGKGFVPYLIVAICLLVIPLIFVLNYFSFKDKRKPANFRFSISIVTAMMIYVNLMVMVVLLAFFVPSLNVSITNVSSMITTVFYPAGLLLAIPFSVCVYSILYHSKRYHLH